MKKLIQILNAVAVLGVVFFIFWIVSPNSKEEFNWDEFFRGFLDVCDWVNLFLLIFGIGLFLFSVGGFMGGVFLKEQLDHPSEKGSRLFVEIFGNPIVFLISITMMIAGGQKWCGA